MKNKSQNNIQNKSQNIKNNKNIKNNLEEAKTSIMSLEKLKIEYSLQLNAYQQAIANYVNYLQQNANTDNSTPSLVTIPGKVFWGSGQTGNPSVSVGGTVEQCQALCSSTTNCSGATYNPTSRGQPICYLRTGQGNVAPSLNTDVAIIPEAQKYLLIIESINKKLISTNERIQNIINQSQPVYNSMKMEGDQQNKELIQNYSKLVFERKKIEEVLKSYEDLEQSEQQGQMKVTQNQYSYILLVIIAIGVIVLLYKFSGVLTSEPNSSQQSYNQSGGEMPQSGSYILLLIIIFIILFNYYSNIDKTTSDGISSVFGEVSSFF